MQVLFFLLQKSYKLIIRYLPYSIGNTQYSIKFKAGNKNKELSIDNNSIRKIVCNLCQFINRKIEF